MYFANVCSAKDEFIIADHFSVEQLIYQSFIDNIQSHSRHKLLSSNLMCSRHTQIKPSKNYKQLCDQMLKSETTSTITLIVNPESLHRLIFIFWITWCLQTINKHLNSLIWENDCWRTKSSCCCDWSHRMEAPAGWSRGYTEEWVYHVDFRKYKTLSFNIKPNVCPPFFFT